MLHWTRIGPANLTFLYPDQGTRNGLTACDCVIYVSLPAKLEHISADTITDESGESVFLIRVRTERNHPGTADKPLKFIPGMTAVVDILTGEKNVPRMAC
ncbi:MAG: hypothetical protein HKP57_03330 [Halobacteria archaeon]|nr:hypothetical protein [Halobacteria archaeon]